MIKKKFSAPTPRAYFGSDKISSWEGTFILADLSRHGLVRRIRTFPKSVIPACLFRHRASDGSASG